MVLGDQCHPPGFSNWCRPEWTIVSGGDGEAVESEAIRAAYQQTGRRLFNTATDRAVQVVLGERKIEVATWSSHFGNVETR